MPLFRGFHTRRVSFILKKTSTTYTRLLLEYNSNMESDSGLFHRSSGKRAARLYTAR